MTEYEYTIRYASSCNINFHNKRDHEWKAWDGDAESTEQIANELHGGVFPLGLEEALDASGFEWWVEIREVANQHEQTHNRNENQ